MAVYFVVQENVKDEAGMQAYSRAAMPTLAGRSVKVLAADPNPALLEGSWAGGQLVVLEFPDEAAFREWYDSPAYQEAIKLRHAASDSNAILVKGLS